MNDPVVILSTAPSREEAKRIARSLVEEKLAACVQIVPGMESVYVWKDKLCEEPEWLLIVKSRSALLSRISERIRSLHRYEVPEIVSLPIVGGSESYLGWLESSLATLDIQEGKT